MKQWYVKFQENGGEYHGYLYIKANDIKKINDTTLLADNVEIQIDEKIISIISES